MDDRDRQAIEELFDKISRVEAQAGPRDRQSEAYVQALITRQPAAPYYMAQTIIVQEQALTEAQRRIEDMERLPESHASGGGFLDNLFGGSRPQARTAGMARDPAAPRGPWGGRGMGAGMGMGGGMGGGGFLAGAAQTAMGVAGGVVLGNMLAGMLTPDQAAAAGIEPGGASTEGTEASGDQTADADAGGDFDTGGGFDMGDF